MTHNVPSLLSALGGIDIYLFDQLQKGRIPEGSRVLDVGCGGGRNLEFFLRSGYEVFAVDRGPAAVDRVQELAAALAPHLPPSNFQVALADAIPFPPASFDLVICIAVLHFARNETEFRTQLDALWDALAPGGVLLMRLASNIGIESLVRPIEGRFCHLPDGSSRFLVDTEMLLAETQRLGASLADPIKTTNVQNLRCMTTWCLTKPAA